MSSPFNQADAHVVNGSLIDGYDAHYADDPLKGMRLGRGQLGGFSGGQGPGKGLSLGDSGAGGLSGGGGSFRWARWTRCFRSSRNNSWL